MTAKRSITAEDLYRFEMLTGARLSPDGTRVVYSNRWVDRETEKKHANLLIVDTDREQTQPFTFGKQTDSSPEWSPDGSTIAFLSNRADPEKPPQIYLISIFGGEATKLTDFKGMISRFCWSPDGSTILFNGVKFDQELIDREQDEKKKKLGIVCRQIDRLFYKYDGVGFLPKEREHIWHADVLTGELKQLTDHEIFDENDASWSPDGSSIVLISNRSPDPDNDIFAQDVYIMPANGGEMKKIDTPRGSKSAPVFSPDGKWIAYYGAEDDGKMYKNTSLWVVRSDGSEAAQNLTEKYDYDVGQGVINDMGSTENMPPIWDLDSQHIYFKICEHGSSILKHISLRGEDVVTVIGSGGDVGSVTMDTRQEKLCYFYGEMMDTGQLYLMDLKSGDQRKLTAHNGELQDELDLGEVEEVWYKNSIGDDLQGWILKPPGFDPEQTYPSILEIHGGPWAMYGNFFMHEFYYLAAQGYIVIFSNPRGGKGYGEAHAAAINENWGGPAFEDLMTLTHLAAEKPYIDPERMGVTGGSYGGYMTNWIIGHTHHFRAAVTQRSVSNMISMWGSGDLNYIFEQEFGGKPPYEDIEILWENSPIKYFGNVKTPTLVIHSEMDLRCAIEQGEQVFVALKRLGVDTEMIRFPEEPHGLSRSGRTDRRIARLEHIAGWFDKYLKNTTDGHKEPSK